MIDEFKVGDKFKRVWPFKRYSYDKWCFAGGIESVEGWAIGCEVHDEQYDEGCGERFHTVHGEGFIEYEVLSVSEMPRKFKDRVIYKIDFIDPDGEVKRTHKTHLATVDKFSQWINVCEGESPYYAEYHVEEQ